MPLLDLLLLVVLVGTLSIYLDRRFIRNRGASAKAPAAQPAPPTPASAPGETPAAPVTEEVQEAKNGSA